MARVNLANVAADLADWNGEPDPKRLARIEDSLTKAYTTLDSISVGENTEMRASRRRELEACDRIELRLHAMSSKATPTGSALSEGRGVPVSALAPPEDKESNCKTCPGCSKKIQNLAKHMPRCCPELKRPVGNPTLRQRSRSRGRR